MPIKSQEMKLTVQVKINGYRDVQALKDICGLASNSPSLIKELYTPRKLGEVRNLINEILNLP